MDGTTQIGVRISLEGAQQATQGLQQTAQGAERLGQSLGKLGPGSAQAANTLNLVGISAGQATNAMRQLPAQITDIVSGLATGQAPLTVLIQQGGQLRDSFGSVGNVLRALGSVITPATVAIGAAASALGALVFGIRGGQAEFDAFNRSLVLSGNAAGTTAAQLSDLARAVGATVGGQARAADALAQLAATGVQLGVGLNVAAEAAIRLERVGGPAIKDTAKALADIAKDPLQASIRLNEQTNFLTVSLYKQIQALTEQGKASQAAAVASKAFADASIGRSKELESSLGTIERGWLKITDAITSAKNALLSIGRPETAASQFDAVQSELDARLQRGPLNDRPEVVASFEKGNAALRARLELLSRQALEESKLGIVQGANARQVREAIDADKDRTKRLKDQGDSAKRAAALLAELSGLDGSYADDLKRLQELRAAGTLSEQRYVEAVEQLIQKQPFARDLERDREKTQRELAKALDDGAKAQAKYLESLDKQIASADDALQKSREELALLVGGNSAREALIQARLDDAAAQAAQNLQAAEARGVGEEEYERLSRLADKLAEVAGIRRQVATATADKELRDTNAKAAEDAAREWARTVDSIRDGLTDAFRRAFESGEDFGTAMAKVIERELKARVATALAGSLADGVLGVLGLQTATGQQQGGGGGAMQQASSLASLYSTGQRLYSAGQSAYQYGVGAYGTLTGNLSTSTAAYTSMANSQALAAYGVEGAGAASGGVAGSAGAASGSGVALTTWAAAIAAGIYKANQDYKEGFNAGGARQVGRETGGAAGTFEALQNDLLKSLGVSDKLASLLSGSTAVAKIIGRAAPRVEAQGVQGTLSGGDFTGAAFVDILQKGGLFRSDKRTTETGALGDDLGRYLDTAAKAVFDKAKDFGAALGLPVDALAKVTTDIKVALTDDAEANQKAIIEALGGYGDALVKSYADAIKPLALYGETTAQTITRVADAVRSVNDVLASLGASALQASIDGGKAAVALSDLFGGPQQLRQAAAGYRRNFYSEAEQADLTRAEIAGVLSGVGINSVPTSRAAFRALVEEQNLLTEAGRRASAALIKVQEDFAAITPSAEDLARSAANVSDRLQALSDRTLTPQGRTDAGYARASSTLAGLGINATPAQLRDTTPAQVQAFVSAWVKLPEATDAARLSLIGVAEKLLDLRDAATEAAARFADAMQRLEELGRGPTTASQAVAGAEVRRDTRRLQEAIGSETVQAQVAAWRAGIDREWRDTNAAIFALGRPGVGQDPATFRTPDVAYIAEGAVTGYLAAEQLRTEADIFGNQPEVAAAISDSVQATNAAAEQTRALIERMQALSRGITDLTTELKTGPLGGMSPEAAYADALSSFRRTASLADSGDADALQRLQAEGRRAAEATRGFLGNTEQGSFVFGQILATLESLGTKLDDLNQTGNTQVAASLQGLGAVERATQATTSAVVAGSNRRLLAAQASVE